MNIKNLKRHHRRNQLTTDIFKVHEKENELLVKLIDAKELSASVVAVQDINVNWNQNNVYDKAKSNKLITSNYKGRTKNNQQCGGTATLNLDKWIGKVELSGADKMGSQKPSVLALTMEGSLRSGYAKTRPK
eukprot:14253612-Ditylum_brightwellii.AAC.1